MNRSKLFSYLVFAITLCTTPLQAMESSTVELDNPGATADAAFDAFEAQERESSAPPQKRARPKDTTYQSADDNPEASDDDSSKDTENEPKARRPRTQPPEGYDEHRFRFMEKYFYMKMKQEQKREAARKHAAEERERRERQEAEARAEHERQEQERRAREQEQAEAARRAAEEQRQREQEAFQHSPAGRLRAGEHNMVGQDLHGADLSGLELTDVDFTDAILDGANLTGIRCHHVNFTRAHMTGVRIDNAIFDRDTTFSHATLVPVSAHAARFDHCIMNEVICRDAILNHTTFTNCQLNDGANFTRASCIGTIIQECSIHNIIFTGTNLTNAHILGNTAARNIRIDGNTLLVRAELRNLSFQQAVIEYVNLFGVTLANVSFVNCGTLAQLQMNYANIEGLSLEATSFTNVDFSHATIHHMEIHSTGAIAKNVNFFDARMFECAIVGVGISKEKPPLPGLESLDEIRKKLDSEGEGLIGSEIFGVGTGIAVAGSWAFPPLGLAMTFCAGICTAGQFAWLALAAKDESQIPDIGETCNFYYLQANSLFENCNFDMATINSCYIKNIIFKNCQGFNTLQTARGSLFRSIAGMTVDNFLFSLDFLREKGAKVNKKTSEDYCAIWGNKADDDQSVIAAIWGHIRHFLPSIPTIVTAIAHAAV